MDRGTHLQGPPQQPQQQQQQELQPASAPAPTAAVDVGEPATKCKRGRACVRCRDAKVRCESSSPGNPNAPCTLCVRHKVECVHTEPARKRAKFSSKVRIGALEAKIDGLIQSLAPEQPRRGSDGDDAGAGQGNGEGSAGQVPDRIQGQTQGQTEGQTQGQTQGQPQDRNPHLATRQDAGVNRNFSDNAATDVAVVAYAVERTPPPPPPPLSNGLLERPTVVSPAYVDIIDRNLITPGQARAFFARYTDVVAPHLPGVVFPAGTTAAEIRRTKPVLFLAVMAAGSSEVPALQGPITDELMVVLAERVVVAGAKSLELVQALLVAVIWFYPPDNFAQLKFYQLVHMAAVMAIDMGLGTRTAARLGLRRHLPQPWSETQPSAGSAAAAVASSLPDPCSVEARRTWLCCYMLAQNTSMTLHRPALVRWTLFMEESVVFLGSAPDAAPTDPYLCRLVLTHKLAERVGEAFDMHDPDAQIDVAHPRTQRNLRRFGLELKEHRASILPDLRQPTLLMSLHIVSLYMHEMGIATDRGAANGNGSSTTEAPLSQAHIDATGACLEAVKGILDVILAMPVESVRGLPVYSFVRVAYAVVVLVKVHFLVAAAPAAADLARALGWDRRRVAARIDALIDAFVRAAEDDRSKPASKFLRVLVHVREWLERHGPGAARNGAGTNVNDAAGNGANGNGANGGASGANGANGANGTTGNMPPPPRPHHHQADHSAAAADTQSLQLLSETAASVNANDSDAGLGPSSFAGQVQHQPQARDDMYWANSTQQQQQQQYLYPIQSSSISGNEPAVATPAPGEIGGDMAWLDASMWMVGEGGWLDMSDGGLYGAGVGGPGMDGDTMVNNNYGGGAGYGGHVGADNTGSGGF